MFMEILYKQTALFPLSSCRYKAAVTFFLLTGFKHLATLPASTPSGSITQELSEHGEEVWASSLRTVLHPDVRGVRRKEPGDRGIKPGKWELKKRVWKDGVIKVQ